mgnify:FL=1
MLKGKNAIVTGANRGIGKETVRCFASHGANVWACVRTPNSEFEQEIQQLQEQYGVWIQPLYFDLEDENAIKAAIKQIMATKQQVDILANVAGITHNALFHMTSTAAFRHVMEVDFIAQMVISQMVTKLMARSGGGSVVNVASFIGLKGNAGQVAYAAAKAALIAATKTMAVELAPKNIRVNAVAPGVIETDMTKDLTSVQLAELQGPVAIQRLGKASEVAELIAFLASERSAYITGQVVRIDGGMR